MGIPYKIDKVRLHERFEKKFEENFGEIKHTQNAPSFPMNFGGTVGEA